MENHRRKFLKQSALATAGSFLIPGFLKAYEQESFLPHNALRGNREKVLVMIQLSGGNDGLNTIVPYQNDIYYQRRPRLAIPKSEVIKVTDELGFNPEMSPLKKLYDEGLLTVLNNVGYPNPDRSHFRSMDIWHSASPSDQYWQHGWLGRYLDATCGGSPNPHMAVEVDNALSLALKGEHVKGLAMSHPKKLHRIVSGEPFRSLNKHYHGEPLQNASMDYLYKTMAETVSSANYIYDRSQEYTTSISYPNHYFGRNLKTIAGLIGSGLNTKVYYTSMNGFDTHVGQKGKQKKLLKQYSEALYAFVRDLKASGSFEDTLIVTFSEFGRRVDQNASGGTDHGKANNLFIVGKHLKKPGFFNSGPDLHQLDEGDLVHQVDFRRIYATLLGQWLQSDAQAILRGQFEPLPFV